MSRLRALLPRLPYSVLIALVLFAVCALLVPRFASVGNLENVLRIAAILAIVACGQATVILVGGIDFSFGSSVALASVVSALAMPVVGPVAGLGIGAAMVIAVGCLNASLIASIGLPAVVVTLGTLMIGHGVAASLAGGLPLEAPPSEVLGWPSSGFLFGVPVPIVVAAIALVGFWLLVARSSLGYRFHLVGANVAAARIAGIDAKMTVFAAYAIAGFFCAAASVILTSRVESGQPNLMPDLAFLTIAACAIGGVPLTGGRASALQVIAGVSIVSMMNNAVVLLNYPAAVQQILIAFVIIASVAATKIDRNIFAKHYWSRPS